MPTREGDERPPEEIDRGLDVRRGVAVHREAEEDREGKDAEIRRRAKALDLIDAASPRESVRTEGFMDEDGMPTAFLLQIFRRKPHREATGNDGPIGDPVIEIAAGNRKWHERIADRYLRQTIVHVLGKYRDELRRIADGGEMNISGIITVEEDDERTILQQSAESVAERLQIQATQFERAAEEAQQHPPGDAAIRVEDIAKFLRDEASMLLQRYAHGCPRRETGLACMLESATSRYHGGDEIKEILLDFGYLYVGKKMIETGMEAYEKLTTAAGKAHAEYHRAAKHPGNFRECGMDVCSDLKEAIEGTKKKAAE